jgi:hypothetical protein
VSATAANVRGHDSSRFYTRAGEAVFEIAKKRGFGMKKPNVVDARELGLLPSTTTILKAMAKPGLDAWLKEQACLAVLTTPRKEGEGLDDFVRRVLYEEQVDKEEAAAAADRGTAIHGAIEDAIQGKDVHADWQPYVSAVFPIIETLGKVIFSEKVVVGDGYAGRCDLGTENDNSVIVTDFKTTSSMPKEEAYKEHRMQAASYAMTLGNTGNKRVLTAVLYISTRTVGETKLFIHDNWEGDYNAFRHLLRLWSYINNYDPQEVK